MAIPPREFDSVTARIVQLDRDLDGFYLSAPDYLALARDAAAKNVHWSTKIEGNPLTEQQVGGTTRRAFENPAWIAERHDPFHQEIINHLVVWLRPELFARPWTVSRLKMIHRILMTGVNSDAKPGALREKGDEVEVRFDDGGTRFIAAPGVHVQEELESLLSWVNDVAPAYRPVIAATILFHEFESIHPFLDGNGRLGRVLFHAYLQTNGLRNSHLCIIEPHVVGDRERYLNFLTWADARDDYTPLVNHVNTALLAAYEEAHQRMNAMDLMSSDLNETAKTIMVNARRFGDWFSVSEATEWIQGTQQTAGIRIRDLCDRGVLEARGQTKSRRFRFSNPLRPFLEATEPHVAEAKGVSTADRGRVAPPGGSESPRGG